MTRKWVDDYQCSICGRKFETMAAHQRHHKTAHPPLKIQERFFRKDRIYLRY